MKNRFKVIYTNEDKIKQIKKEQRNLKIYTAAFTVLAITNEISATMYAPDLYFAGCVIVNTIGAGICLTRINNNKEKIKKYENKKS